MGMGMKLGWGKGDERGPVYMPGPAAYLVGEQQLDEGFTEVEICRRGTRRGDGVGVRVRVREGRG